MIPLPWPFGGIDCVPSSTHTQPWFSFEGKTDSSSKIETRCFWVELVAFSAECSSLQHGGGAWAACRISSFQRKSLQYSTTSGCSCPSTYTPFFSCVGGNQGCGASEQMCLDRSSLVHDQGGTLEKRWCSACPWRLHWPESTGEHPSCSAHHQGHRIVDTSLN